MAFTALLDAGDDERGIFTGADPLADKVIRVGDPLFGSTISELFSLNESLNDSGQIAFFYSLSDGRFGIARADPLVIPEPGTLPLFIAHCWARCCGGGINKALVKADARMGRG